jgi:asparagine synthetase B (glutamine-hydrolysing)
MSDRARAAFHEAGHSVIAHRFHRAPRVIEISDDGEGNTICLELRSDARHRFSPERYRELVIEEIHVWSAGQVAEEIFAGTSDSTAARVDTERVQFWLAELQIGSGRTLARATRRMLTERRTWEAVEAVATLLIETGAASGREVEALCQLLKVPRVA